MPWFTSKSGELNWVKVLLLWRPIAETGQPRVIALTYTAVGLWAAVSHATGLKTQFICIKQLQCDVIAS